jgi:glyoxalase family protein
LQRTPVLEEETILSADIKGIHHYTSCVGGAQEDFDFHARLLGLRHLKQTGLYEGEVPIYHLYYGNTDGDPGSVLTTFPMRQQGLKGHLGSDQVYRLNLSIPRESVGFWVDRLQAAGVEAATVELYGTERIHFIHPCGIPHALVADGYGDETRSWDRNGVSAEHAILGNHGMTIHVSAPAAMATYLDKGLGAVQDGEDSSSVRWRLGDEPGRVGFVELVEDRESPAGTKGLGEGTVHHCAWDVGDEERQSAVRGHLEGLGYERGWLGPADRGYFVSVYNRTPSGALFEYAWSKPESWTIDEPLSELGRTFKVPPMFLEQRDTMAAYLEPIDIDTPVTT